MEGFGNTMSKVADEYTREQDAQAVFSARRQLDDWERDAIYNPEKGAVSRRGRDAFELTTSLPADFDKAAGKISEGLTSERQRRAFAEMAASRRSQVGEWADRYTLQQKESYDAGQYDADIKSFIDRAALFPDKAAGELDVMKNRTIGYMRGRGRSSEEIAVALKDQASALHSHVLTTMLNAGDGEGAQGYLEANRPDMTADAADRAGAALKEIVARSKAQTFADTVMAKGLDLPAALAAAREKFSGKEEDAATQELKARFAEGEVIHNREEKKNSDSAWKVISAGGGRNQISPGVWDKLDGREQAQINDYVDARWRRAKADAKKDDKVETDMDVYYGLRRMAVDDPAAFGKVDLMKSKPFLKDPDLKHLMEIQGSLVKGDTKEMDVQRTVKRTINLVRSSIASAGIDLTPKEGTNKAKQTEMFFGALTQALDDATAVKKAPLTDDEAKRIGMGMLRDEFEQGSGLLGMFQNKKRAFEIPAEQRGKFVSKKYDDIPPDIRKEIEAELYPKVRRVGVDYGPQGGAVDKERVERVYQRALDAGRIK